MGSGSSVNSHVHAPMRGYRALHERPDPNFLVAVALCLPARFSTLALLFLLGASPLFARLTLEVHARRSPFVSFTVSTVGSSSLISAAVASLSVRPWPIGLPSPRAITQK